MLSYFSIFIRYIFIAGKGNHFLRYTQTIYNFFNRKSIKLPFFTYFLPKIQRNEPFLCQIIQKKNVLVRNYSLFN